MGNQLIREQLFEILHNRKRMPGEQFSDIEGKIENLVNQEVVKRIADRMLTDEEITHEATDRYANKITGRVRSNLWAAFRKGAKWSRSRMMKISSSQKTEGGQ